jgi:RNA polymerase sigma-70 factor (ECF subfamily)
MQLRQRLIDRDHDALAECYDQYCSLVYTVALRTTGDRSAADDVTQDVFLKLWARPLSLDLTKGTTRAWLGRVAHNRAVDWVRSEAAHDRRHRVNAGGTGPPDVQEALDAVFRAAEVRAALEALPPDERIAIRLAYFSNMTYQNVAIELGVPEGTAKSRIRVGLRRMAAALHAGVSEPGS